MMIASHRFIFIDECEYGTGAWCRLCGQFDNTEHPGLREHGAKLELDRVLAQGAARVRAAVGGQPARVLAVGA